MGRLGVAMTAVGSRIDRRGVPTSRRTENQIEAASGPPLPAGYPHTELLMRRWAFGSQNYGIRGYWQMFSARQLSAMVACPTS